MTRPAATRARLACAAFLLVSAASLALTLGMRRGVVLSAGVKSKCWPWAPYTTSLSADVPYLSDPVWQFVPWISFARRELLAGRLPLWNPHQDGGVPLLGNAISALSSPVVWPALLLGVEKGWNVSLLLRVLVAGLGAFLFARDRGRSRIASLLAAAAFSLSGPFTAWLEHPQTATAAFAPFVLLFTGRLAERRDARAFVGLALATYAVLAGGHPETAAMIALLGAAYLAVRLTSLRSSGASIGAAALGAMLAAPVLLPFAEYFLLSAARHGADRVPPVLPWRDLVRFLLPSDRGSHPVEAAATVSLAALALLPFGLAAAKRSRDARFFAFVALAALLVAYDTPLSRLLATTSIFFSRALLLLPLALGFLAAEGLDLLRERARRAGDESVAGLVAALLAAAAAAELVLASRDTHAVVPRSALRPETPLLTRLGAEKAPFRILPLHTFLPPNTATDYDLDDVRGYDALAPEGWRRNREAMGRFTNIAPIGNGIEPWHLAPGGAALDFWNVKYLLLHPQLRSVEPLLTSRLGLDLVETYAGPDGQILENRRVLPRARFDPPDAGAVAILESSPTRWRFDVNASRAAVFVLANPFFPGWSAAVDGARVPLRLSPGAPIAFAVEKGRHAVEIVYRPASFRIGLALAAIGAIALVAAFVRLAA